ncbi:uncharacterized protein LOC114261909 [Camellia sinensis]|uniref:uncharacterized protein LOC114261909 n=1 Tax=Camellia sinensis TaxID=4442 RepID=UPI001036AE8E|nr:uncharacterized protein LOC114261909 [Camellia sinensis]
MFILFNLIETELQKSETKMGIPSTMRDAWENQRNSPLIASPAEDQKILNSRHCTQEGVRAGVKAASIACVGSAMPTLESADLVILEEEEDATSVSVGSEALDQLRVGTRRVVADLGAKGWTLGAIESLLEIKHKLT